MARLFNDSGVRKRILSLHIYKKSSWEHPSEVETVSVSAVDGDTEVGGKGGAWSRSGEELKMHIRSLFSQCHRRWSISGQNDPDGFINFLPVRARGEIGTESKNALALLRAPLCGEVEDDTDILNFTTKIAPSGVSVELGHGDTESSPPISRGKIQ